MSNFLIPGKEHPRTGLDFLSTYSDDDDEDEIEPSGTFSTSTVLNNNTDPTPFSFGNGKRTPEDRRVLDPEKLPIPDTLINMFSGAGFSSSDLTEESGEHQGRVRSFPHVRGNWASYVYINYSTNPGLKRIIEILPESIRQLGTTQAPSEVFISNDFHLSLTKTQVFKHHWIDQFLHSLNSKLKVFKQFVLDLNVIQVYVNEERTRTFLAVEAFPSDSLLRLVADCDRCLSDYDLLPYYEEPSFHVSFAWMVGNHEDWIRKYLLPVLNCKWEETCDEEPSFKKSLVDSIGFRTGNKTYVLPLPP